MRLIERIVTVPISENFARSLDLKKFFFELGSFVVVEPVGVFFPTEDLKLKAEWNWSYVGTFEACFI